MNQKGEITLFSCLLVLVLSSLLLVMGLELQKSFLRLEKRTKLFLCVKETKGELHKFLKLMGRTNWGIRNVQRIGLVMMVIPGLQGASLKSQKIKKYLQFTQQGLAISYLKTISDLRKNGCSLDPRMFITPFEIDTRLLQRDKEGAAILRGNEWTYYFVSRPYLLELTVNAEGYEAVNPTIRYEGAEKAAKLSSLFFSL